MKLKKLIKVLHPNTVIAVDDDRDVKVVKVSNLDDVLKERQVKRLYSTTSDNVYDFYIELRT